MDYSIGSRAKHLDEAGWCDSYYPEEWGPNNYRRDEIKQASCTAMRANKIKLSHTSGPPRLCTNIDKAYSLGAESGQLTARMSGADRH